MTKKLTKAEALNRLQASLDTIDAIQELMPQSNRSPKFFLWHRDTRIAISHIFGSNSAEAKEFPPESRFKFPWFDTPTENERQDYYQRALAKVAPLLESMIAQIRDYWPDDNDGATHTNHSRVEPSETKNSVFVVHGRDEGTKEAMARFLENLGLVAVVLHEQPNQGRTIIEKFEEYAQTGFAVVLLTPDDLGAPGNDNNDLKPRARQNVIFEFGYFIAKLGRKRVCALVKENVEWPSDYDGVLHIKLDDANGWKLELARELKGVGFEIDLNRAK